MKCLEDLLDASLLNVKCRTIQALDGASGELFLEKLDRCCDTEEKHEGYSVAP